MSVVGNFDIEDAIYQRFTLATDRRFAKVDLGSFPDSSIPGLNVAVATGKFEMESMAELRQDIDITLLVAAKNINSEMQRRRLIHPLVEYVVRSLVSEDLGLDIDPIVPMGWSERTSIAQFTKGEIVFEVRFRTASRIPAGPLSDAEEEALDLVWSSFGPNPTTDPNVPPVLAGSTSLESNS